MKLPWLRAVSEAQRSFDQLRQLVQAAVANQCNDPNGYSYAYVCDMYDDYVIAGVSGQLLSFPWAIQDGAVVLGEPTEVMVTYAPTSAASGDGDHDGDDGVLAPAGVPTQESRRLSERDFSSGQRKSDAKSGMAMPDGSFPIEDVADLKNAVKAYGRAKDKAAAKAHITKRAKALKATDQLPADWEGSTKQSPSESAATPLALGDEVIPLVETAVRADDTIKLKVIQPGWGSSGYYAAEMLERDGPQAFPADTKLYWNHPSLSEERDRPERDLRDLAAVTTTPASWDANGPAGPGLYAEAKVFDGYRAAVESLAPHIGVSIRAEGKAATGTVDGRTGPVIEAITAGHSIDFVTTPGAGGEILQLFEAARAPQERSTHVSEVQQLTEALAAERARNDRLERAFIATQAEAIVERGLAAQTDLQEAARERVRAAVMSDLPLAEGQLDVAAFGTRLGEAVKRERDYIASIAASLGAGRVTGMGVTSGAEESLEQLDAQLAEALKSL